MSIRWTKPKLIVLDDNADRLQQIAQAARAYYQVIPTGDVRWATAWLGQYADVSVFVASEELAGPNLALFYRAQAMRGDVMRVLLVPRTESPRLAGAVAQGTIHQLLLEPFDDEALLEVIGLENVGIEVSPHQIEAG